MKESSPIVKVAEAYILGTLSDADAAAFEEHLLACGTWWTKRRDIAMANNNAVYKVTLEVQAEWSHEAGLDERVIAAVRHQLTKAGVNVFPGSVTARFVGQRHDVSIERDPVGVWHMSIDDAYHRCYDNDISAKGSTRAALKEHGIELPARARLAWERRPDRWHAWFRVKA